MKRRGNSEGCITKDSRGKWIARLQIGCNSNGNPRIKTFSGKTTTEARRRMNNFKKNLANMDGLTKAEGLMSEGMRYWSDKYKKPTLKPSSYDRLMQTIEYQIIPYIGNYMIQKVSTEDIQDSIINRMQKQGLSHSSIKKAYEALNGFFRQYVIERKIVFNPMVGVILPSKNQFNTKQLQVLSGDEMKKFISVAAEKLKKGECRYRYGYGLIFVLYTGLREGEVLALQYKHLDLKNRKVRIEQNLVMVTDGSGNKKRRPLIQRSVKTEAGVREIPLCDIALEAISNHIALYYTGNDEDYVFKTRTGTHLTPHNISKAVNQVFKRAKIDASGMHILRHSFASYLFAKGLEVKYISKILGHSSIQITYDTYVHTDFEQLKQIVTAI